ncbi:unnamed protein product [Diatraea saccharalis]|uniref:Peptidase S1 domain-containing protein n=1 Tax=Diatraea saccharalis TaxID=40085 RepID=A0A9N9QU62_9NEOP|nr:unnamed protein product [Diatraea saccharalis]
MCDVCCKEIKGWCKSFTRIEAILSALEGALLIIFIGLLALLILHFIVCKEPTFTTTTTTTSRYTKETIYVTDYIETYSEPSVEPIPEITTQRTTEAHESSPQNKDCTWTPSKKTQATTRYYETDLLKNTRDKSISIQYPVVRPTEVMGAADESEGEDAGPVFERCVLALVKTRPHRDMVFGCILTIVSDHWTLTAASCIEAIEEVDSLDSFVIMESYGKLRNGIAHGVTDVQINPFYRGTNASYDLAALKTDASLVERNGVPVRLPEMLDYFLVPPGEKFTILGYGNYRTISKNVLGRSLREVHVHSVPSVQCYVGEDKWAPRHLWGGAGAGAGASAGAACAVGALCAGSLYARGLPCNYCAGTPLLNGRLLLGVMSGNAQCGITCEPALYVNIAVVRDWLDYVIESD